MQRKLKKIISLLLTSVMLISCFGSAGFRVFAATERVKFLEADGSENWTYDPISMNDNTYELVGGEHSTKWYATGSYVSPNNGEYATLHHGVTVRGDVSLIIRDNLHLIIEGGIYVTENSKLTIYGQSNAPNGLSHYTTGTLSAVATDNAAGIGGKEGALGGHIVINSGVVSGQGEDGAGIGGGYGKDSGFQSVTINGGFVTAQGDGGGAGIGDGEDNTKSGGSVITINGGTVDATGGNLVEPRIADGGGAGIGGGEDSEHSGASIIINGGTVNAQGGDDSAGIGGGENSRDWRSITINGGTVNATGGNGGITDGGGGAGIGGGQNRGNGVIRINGGTIVAKAGGLDEDSDEHGAGIGGGSEGSQDNPIYITGGDVKAYGGVCGAGIGGGADGQGNDVYISGGTVYAQAGSWADGIGGGKCTKETAPWRPVVTIPKPGNTYISGGVVTATTTPNPTETENGAGIGCWAGKTDGGEVVISGGVVFAHSTGLGAGIGSGRTMGSSGGKIKISNAYVVATSYEGAGIGSQGSWSDNHVIAGETVEIDNSYVFASSSKKGAGIGGGNDGDGCPVIIKNSVVEAFGGNVDYDWYAEHGAVNLRGTLIQLEGKGGGMEINSVVTGMIASAVITALNQLIYSGDYRGAGIGGGDEGAGGDVTIENSSVLAVGGGDQAHAFGHGHDTSRTNGTLTLGDDLMVSAGSDESALSPVNKDARTNATWDNYCAKIEPCAHDGATYRGAPDGHCVESCPYCALSFDENNLTPHTFADNKLCTVCGYQGVQVSFRSGNYAGYAEPVIIGKGAQFKLPGALFTECEDHGYMQTGWLCGGIEYGLDDTFTVNDDVTVTALYQMYNDVMIVDSDYGSAAADKAYAVPGSVVTVTATPDTGCRLSGIKIRANGATVYEKNETGTEGIDLTHSFTMPQYGNAAVYTTFSKNYYNVRTSVDIFDTEIEVEVNGRSADTASYGDEITVHILPNDDIQSVVWVKTDADGNETGQRHSLALSSGNSASFTMDVMSDILIKPNLAHEHDGIEFFPWGNDAAEQTSLPRSGNYYLTHDIVLSSSFNPNGNENHICLNGHTITVSDDFTDATVFDIYARYFFVHDHDNSGVIDGKGKCRLFNLTNSRLTLYGGTLTGGYASEGGVVNVSRTNNHENFCSFTMFDGVITGNRGNSSGIISTGFAKTVITGGEITNNETPAVLDVQKTGSLEISGSPKIYGNHRPGSTSTGANVLLHNTVYYGNAYITITGPLSEDAIIGVTANGSPSASNPIKVTSGLEGNGTLKNFFSDEKDLRAIGILEGEIAVGQPITISFDSGGAQGYQMPEVKTAAGCDYTLPPDTYTPPSGAVFGGWRIGDTETILQPDAVIAPTSSVTLYAVWNGGSGGDTVIPEWHTHRWEIKLDESNPAKATVRCVYTTLGGDALCNETELKTVDLQTDGQSGAEYTRAYNGKAATTVAYKQKAYVWTTAFPEDDLISVSAVTYYDETGALLDAAPTDVGVYTARATVSPVNGRGDTVTITKTINIVKAPAPEITVTGLQNLPLTNSDQPLVEISDSASLGAMHYRVNGGSWSYCLPTEKESGEYTVEWYFDSQYYEGIHSKDEPGVVNASISELHEHDGIRFTRWTDTDSLPKSGNYFLANDVVWKGPWTITGELNLCLYGHTVNFVQNENFPYTNIFVNNGGTLSLYDDGNGKLCGKSDMYVEVRSGGTLNNYSACIEAFGSSIKVVGGTFNMYGGSVVNSSAVTVTSGTFNMSGGVIRNNDNYGVRVSGGSFNLSGNAEIRDNILYGIDITNSGRLNVSGSPRVRDNGNGNVWLKDGSKINVTGILRGADIGINTEDNPYSTSVVFTSGYNTFNDGVHPSRFFTVDNIDDDRIFIGKNDDGEAYIGVHSHHFIVEPASGSTDTAYAYCDTEGCPLGNSTILTFSLSSEDAVFDVNYHQATFTKPDWNFSGLEVSSLKYTKDGEDFEGLNPWRVGEYTASATITGAEQSVTITTSFTIAKAQASVSVTPGENLVYNNGQSTIATFKGVDGGYIRYAVDSKDPNSFTNYLFASDLPPQKPFVTDVQVGTAGWHTVYYFVVNDDDHLPLGSIEEPIELNVLIKANVTMFGKTNDESTTITVDPSAFTAPECPFEAPEGKVFGYWRVNYKTIGDQLNVGDSYSFTKNIKLYPIWVDPPHEHIYGEPEWIWAEDYAVASAAFTCVDGDDTQTVSALVEKSAVPGTITYTAHAEFMGETYTDEKTVTCTHTPGEAVIENETPARCDAEGCYDEAVYCEVCKEEISRRTVTVARTEHTPNEAVTENRVEATYEEEGGWDEVIYCSVCKNEISRVHHVIDRLSPEQTDPSDEQTTIPDGSVTDGACKYCGRVHGNSFLQRLIALFHRIFYFFQLLFGLR